MRFWRHFLVFAATLPSLSGLAQQSLPDNRHCQTITVNQVIVDEQIIAPSSIHIPDSLQNLIAIELLSEHSFVLRGKGILKAEVCYRVLPEVVGKQYSMLSSEVLDSTTNEVVRKKINEPLLSQREELFSMGDLNQGGQISRGITVGNTQDLFVNSSLNLNLEGKIANDLTIRASITDQQIPYQPEGNTQQLQDFDNVFVELYNDKFSVKGGDIVLRNSQTYFLKYLKNVQGGMVGVNHKGGKSSVGISAAKGQFASTVVAVTEGTYGPYQIRAANTGYTIILANSEKVYLDGQQLTRGYDRDYIIDYNQAEITFTSNVVITKYSRVRVDYEYAVQSFNRSITHLAHEQQIGKATLDVNYYRESDNRNRPLFYELTGDEKSLLAAVGDDTEKAIVSGARQATFSPDRILYIAADTLNDNGEMVNIFKYSTNTADSLYSVSFTDVGEGSGSYSIASYRPEGKVFEWVGEGRGRFAPYRQLEAPQKKEMLDVVARIPVGEHSEINLETALSNHDKNLFSDLDNGNNQGYAIKAGYRIRDKQLSFSDYKLQSFIDLEFLNKDFNPIDRFRRVEFDRDWSFTPTDSVPVNDFVLSLGFGLRKDVRNGFNYGFNFRNKESSLQGNQHQLSLNKSLGKFQVNLNGFMATSDLRNYTASWRKISAETYYDGVLQPGYRYALQQNLNRLPSDSIIASANYFTSHEFFLRNNPNAGYLLEAAWQRREDYQPAGIEMQQSDRSDNARLRFSKGFQNGHSINMVFNYRVLNELLPGQESIASVTGRIDWSGDIIRNVLRQELNYSVANARVPKREYVFVEVPTGEGTHTWRDDNQDGVKDLDEFYEAIFFDERNYIKLYVNTSEFLDAYENNFNYRVNIRAPRSWKDKAGMMNLLSRITNSTSWASHYRTTEDNLSARLIPFFTNIDDGQVLSMKEALRTTFFFNKANPKFGMSAGFARFRKKYLYANGFEARSDEEVNLKIRWNIRRYYTLKLNSFSALHGNRSDYLDGRNYDIRDYRVGPSFSFQPKPTLRLTGSYQAGLKRSSGSTETPSRSVTNEVMAELKMGMAARYMINMTVKYTGVQYNGNELSALGYEMLQGLRPGNNYSWNIGWQQKLLNGLQLSLFYEGRMPDGRAVIHSGRASVSALF